MPSGSGYLATNYKADMAIIDTRFRRFWLGVAIVGIIVFPLVTGAYYVHLINLVAIACIAAFGLQAITGWTGIVSLGHAGVLAVGGFMAAIFGYEFGLPFLAVLLIAMVASAITGLIMGLPVLRLRGFYVVLSTLAVHFVIIFAATWYQSVGGYTAGYTIPSASIGGWVLDSGTEWFYFLSIVVAIVTLFCINLGRSRVGRAWIAIRDKDIVAEALGVNVGYYKLLVFMFGSALAGLAGALSGYYMHYIAVEQYSLWLAITYIAIAIIGGLGSILGVFLGSFFVILLPYILSAIFSAIGVSGAMQNMVYSIQFALFGFFIILFLVFEPEGLVGIWRDIRSFFEQWPFKFRRVVATR